MWQKPVTRPHGYGFFKGKNIMTRTCVKPAGSPSPVQITNYASSELAVAMGLGILLLIFLIPTIADFGMQ
jgi:hypothetical protein